MAPKDILTKEFLVEEYVEKKKSILVIAKENGIKSSNSVSQALKRLDIQRPHKFDKSHITKEFIEKYYIKENLSLKEVAAIAGNTTKSMIGRLAIEYGICKKNKKRTQKFIKASIKKRSHPYISGKYFANLMQGARQRDLEVNIDQDFLWELFQKQNGKCALSGVKIKLDVICENKKDRTASVDRIDPSKGYTKDNVQWVHKTVNYMKMDLVEEEFIEMCKLIARNSK